ncbi:uncharacterized protein BJ212DRAFT_1460742, partial [Suillus subaureus]
LYESTPSPPDIDVYSPPPPLSAPTGTPTDFLKGVVGKKVILRLTSGVDYRVTHRCGDVFIRGNNVLHSVRWFQKNILSCL